MYRIEPCANGSRPFLHEDPQPGSFNSMLSSLPDSGQFSAAHIVAPHESALLYDGQDGGHMHGGGVAELFDGQYFLSTDEYNYASQMETEQYQGPPMSASSFDSVVSDSTFASDHTTSILADQGEDSAENLDNIFESIFPLLPELLPAYGDRSFMYDASYCQAHESVCVPMENDGSFHVEESVTNPRMNVLPAMIPSARTRPCFVRLVCACHRLRSKTDMLKGFSKKGINGKRKRSAKSPKHSREIRISKKIPKDGKYLKEKAWLGTYATLAQAGRALDVGKYFLNAKKKKTFSDPNSEATLLAFKDLQALPLTELVGNVIKLAKYYGEKGSLPESLECL